jgi:hypothetical protein
MTYITNQSVDALPAGKAIVPEPFRLADPLNCGVGVLVSERLAGVAPATLAVTE